MRAGARCAPAPQAAAPARPHAAPAAAAAAPSLPATRRALLLASVGVAATLIAPGWAAADAPPPNALPALDSAGAFDGGTVVLLDPADAASLTMTELQILDNNRRVQAANGAPPDFPAFVRAGFEVKVVPPSAGYAATDAGLIYLELAPGAGEPPVDGQEVAFDYVAYNESGARIDSSANKGRPAVIRLGIGGLIPGFELGVKGMRPGGARRLIVPPALGPPVGPQTFFSAKQCEVFDVSLRTVKSCERRQVGGMFSSVVCE